MGIFFAFASESDLQKAKELNDSQTYDSLYLIPELKALYYQNKHIIDVIENIDKNLQELLHLLKKNSKSEK